jgi:hypothetical protein
VSALREILAVFGVEFDSKQLDKGGVTIDGMVGKLKSFGQAVAGAFVVKEIVDFTREVAAEADQLAKTSAALGLNAQSLQEWRHAAGLSGVDAGLLDASFNKLARNASEAANGGKTQAEAFKRLGVEVKDQSGALKPLGRLFEEAGVAVGGIENPTEKAALAMEIFGKSGAKLIPLFAEGKEGMAALRAEVEELGFAFDDAFLDIAQEANDNVDRFNLALKGLKIRLASEVLPIMSSLAISTARIVAAFGKLLKNTEFLKAGLISLGLVGLVKLSALIGPLASINTLLRAGAGLLLKYIIPFLILEDFIVFLQGGDSAIGDVLDKLFGEGASGKVRKFITDVIDSVKAFFDDLRNRPGKVVEDFKLFWETLQADAEELFGPIFGGILQGLIDFWYYVINALTGGWDNFLAATNAAWEAILLALEIVWTELKFGFLAVGATINDAFEGVWNNIIAGAQAALATVRDVISKLPGTSSIVEGLNQAITSVGGATAAANLADTIGQQRTDARLAIAQKGDQLGRQAAVATAGGVLNAPVNNTVNVTVPPGTPAQQAKAVAKAAQGGVQKGMAATPNPRATKAGLVQQAG